MSDKSVRTDGKNPAASNFLNLLRPLDVKKTISLVVLFAYTWAISILQAIKTDTAVTWVSVVLLGLFSAGLTIFVYAIFEKFKLTELKTCASAASKKRAAILIVIVFLVTFFFFMMYFGAQYPGGVSPDTITQYEQVLSGDYNNWHPVLHTLLFFTIPLKAGGHFGLIVFLQLLYFCLAFTYLIYVLYKNGCPMLPLCLICIFVWINPYLATYLMYPWKDIALVIFAMLLVGFYIQIVGSKGVWFQKIQNIILFAAVVVVCTYVRHNAILFTAPLVVILFFYGAKNKKIKLYMAIFIAAFALLVQGLYAYIDVESPNLRVVEEIGFPATIWSNVMKKNPDALPEETRDFFYELAPKEAYEEKYIIGNFNSIKWSEVDLEKMDTLSYKEVLHYTWQCFRYAPKASMEAAVKLSAIVWSVDGSYEPTEVSIDENEWGIQANPKAFGGNLFEKVMALSDTRVGKLLFGTYGIEIWTMLAVGFILLARGRISILHFLPLFCYDFGSMLMLSGDSYRFFLLTIPLWFPMIFLMYKDKTTIKDIGHRRAKSDTRQEKVEKQTY